MAGAPFRRAAARPPLPSPSQRPISCSVAFVHKTFLPRAVQLPGRALHCCSPFADALPSISVSGMQQPYSSISPSIGHVRVLLDLPHVSTHKPCSASCHSVQVFCAAVPIQKKAALDPLRTACSARSAQSRPAPSRWCLRQPHATSSICATLVSRRQKSLVSPSLVSHCFWISSA